MKSQLVEKQTKKKVEHSYRHMYPLSGIYIIFISTAGLFF